MTHVNWGNIIMRAVWTFMEGALATITILPYITDHTGWVNVANGAIAGGLAALFSFVKTLAQEMVKPPPADPELLSP
jgi:hypothetical protein